MKKLLRKDRMIPILSVILVFVLAFTLLAQADWPGVIAQSKYAKEYTELSTAELDDLSYRDSISDDLPQMTVFIHGLGGKASHWASNGAYKFDYEANSMPETLRRYINTLSGEDKAEIIVVRPSYDLMNSNGTTKTIQEAQSDVLTDENNTQIQGDGATSLRRKYEEYQPDEGDWGIEIFDCNEKTGENRYSYPKIDEIDDTKNDSADRHKLNETEITKHIIVIFEQWKEMPREGNDFVYSQFEYCMDALSYQYAQLAGELPTVNLIAHSRGGITAMQYALAHPYNVASIYTMGAPFNGSDFGSIESGGSRPCLSLANYKNNYTYTDGTDYAPGILDILNSELSESYKSFWNKHYQEFYSHIQFKPIGSYVSSDFILAALIEYLNNSGVVTEGEILVTALAFLTKAMLSVKRISSVFFVVGGMIASAIVVGVFDVLEKTLRDTEAYPIIKAFSNLNIGRVSQKHIGKYSLNFLTFEDDLFINLDSQVAKGYEGADARAKLFQGEEQSGKKSVSSVGVAHNLETHNKDIINYIVKDLNFGMSEGIYSARYNADGTCCITNLNNVTAQGKLVIPETYNGYTVIGVESLTEDLDISGDEQYHTGITEIEIPSTVKSFGDYAFFGMSNLQKISFTGQDNIEEIGLCAFGNCISLNTMKIGAKTSFIGGGAFGGCDSLSAFSMEAGNSTFSCADGIIYSKDGTALNLFPAGRSEMFIVPDTVTTISAAAFCGNNKLTSVDLNNVTVVYAGGFADCTNLSEIIADKLEYAEIGAFENTKWMEDNSEEFVSLGNVLLKYQGNAEELHISAYKSICELAFVNNTHLKRVYFDGNNLNNIGFHVFNGCTNLEEIYIGNSSRVVGINGALFDSDSDVQIFVPSNHYEDYQTNEIWMNYAENIKELTIIVNFVDEGQCVDTKSIKYGETFSDIQIPEKSGYNFLGWFTNQNAEGQLYQDGVVNSATSNLTLYANWEPISYGIIYDLDGGENSEKNPIRYTVEDDIILENPVKIGNTFVGWQMNGIMLEDNHIAKGMTGNLNLKAVWQPNTISVGFDSKGTTAYPASKVGLTHVLFGQNDFIFEVPIRNGFIFQGWYYNGVQYTTNEGNAARPWDLTSSTVLYAEWEAESFKIRYDTETGSIYFSGSDWTDEEVEVTVGMQLKNENIIEETFRSYYRIENKIISYFYYLKPDGTQAIIRLNSNLMPVFEATNGTVEFFAQYQTERHTMYFTTGVEGQQIQSITAESGSNIKAELDQRIPVRPGYEFGGWKIVAALGNESLLGLKVGYVMLDCTEFQAHGSCMAEAIWIPTTVTIDLDSNGGNDVGVHQVVMGENYTLPVPKRLGYIFIGWFNSDNIQYTDATGKSLNSLDDAELLLFAHWEAQTYNITYQMNGGTNVSRNPKTYKITDNYTLIDPTKNGYRFMGWYLDAQFATKITKIQSMTGDITLYAKWAQIHTVTVKNGTAIREYSGIIGDVFILPVYSKVGFDGIIKDNVANKTYRFAESYTIAGTRTLEVIWTSNDIFYSYTVRTAEKKITDNGRWTNHIDEISITKLAEMDITSLKNKGYKKLKLRIIIDIKEREDGYQYIMIYDGKDKNTSKQLDGVTIEHGGTGRNKNYKTYSYSFILDLDNIPSNYIYILYGASGFGNDDWYNRNVKVEATFTQIE